LMSVELDRQRTGLRIEFPARQMREKVLVGTVVDPTGEPIVDAIVFCGGPPLRSARSNETGMFYIPLLEDAGRFDVIARGFEPAVIAPRVAKPSSVADYDSPLQIVLQPSGAEHRICGQVVDALGHPVAGARVQRLTGTLAGVVRISGGRFAFGPGESDERSIESLIQGTTRSGDVDCDEDGRFAIASLPGREYRLRAFEPRTMKLAESEPISAGSDGVRLVIPDEPVHARIAGIVVDAGGAPVQGAEVRLYRHCEDLDLRRGTALLDHLLVTTGSDGRFELRDVARSAWAVGVRQRLKGQLSRIELADTPDLESLRVVVASTCHVRIDATGSDLEFREVGFVDAHGQRVWITEREGRRSSLTGTTQLHGRRSAVLQVPTNAVQLNFQGDGGIVLRLPVKLEPGGFHVIRP
jgi:hypothetical protein